MYIYPMKSLPRDIDGDTFEATLDTGFRNTHTDTFRLAGLNAGEKDTEVGKDAITYVAEWFTQHPGPWEVRTEKNTLGAEKQEKYGRWLATVMAPDGHVLNDDLIAIGLAAKWDGKGARPNPPGRNV